MILLMPENKLMEPKVYPAQRVQIQGVVVGQLRKLSVKQPNRVGPE